MNIRIFDFLNNYSNMHRVTAIEVAAQIFPKKTQKRLVLRLTKESISDRSRLAK